MDTTKPYLKAGLIGGGIAVSLSIIGMIPIINCLALPVQCIAFFALPMGVGYFSAHLAHIKREDYLEGAKQGVLGSVIAGLIGSVVSILITGLFIVLGFGMTSGINWTQNMNFGEITSDTVMGARDFTAFVFGSVCGTTVHVLLYSVFGAIGGLLKVLTISETQASNPAPKQDK
ncbi:hypothetical protein GF362_03645 [Candidatus Dojkabacteria bacterium]|nr:hypothetical protein [Candidatus Dojkabacteria bacterium]